MKLQIMLKKPEFPVLCSFNNTVVSFSSEADIGRKIFRCPIRDGGNYDVVDSKAACFILFIRGENIFVGPAFFNTKWTKKKLIDLYNNRDNRRGTPPYTPDNPGAKRMSVIIGELAGLLEKNNARDLRGVLKGFIRH